MKVWLDNTLIQILEAERSHIQKENPKARLVKTSRGKRKGGGTYYCFDNDIRTLKILARLRDISVRDLIGERISY